MDPVNGGEPQKTQSPVSSFYAAWRTTVDLFGQSRGGSGSGQARSANQRWVPTGSFGIGVASRFSSPYEPRVGCGVRGSSIWNVSSCGSRSFCLAVFPLSLFGSFVPCGHSGLAPCCVALIIGRRSMQASLGTDSEDRILRLPEVLRLLPVSRSAWYKGVAEGRYPAGIKFSPRAVGWRKSEIDKLVISLSRGRHATTQ